MAGISSKAALSSLSVYKYNAGSELEDEGGLNYYNTFYRKYDAQIGRFTGVDVYAGKFAGLNPYQYGANNPIMFNDPMGDKFGGANGERLSQMNANPMGSEFGWSYDFGEGGGGGGGGSHSGFDRNGFNASGAAARSYLQHYKMHTIILKKVVNGLLVLEWIIMVMQVFGNRLI